MIYEYYFIKFIVQFVGSRLGLTNPIYTIFLTFDVVDEQYQTPDDPKHYIGRWTIYT